MEIVLFLFLVVFLWGTRFWLWPSVRHYIWREQLIFVTDKNDETWYANLKKDEDGKLYCYRWPCHSLGKVDLETDGYGWYCGLVRWVKI